MEENIKTYIALPFNKEPLNIETIYFTENYLKEAKVNPATAKDYSADEKQALEEAPLTSPEEAYMAVTSYSPKALLWFDEKATKAIVKYTDALMIKDNSLVTSDGTVVATAISYLKDIDLSLDNLTALHSSMELTEEGLRIIKTEKIEEDDTNSYVTVNGLKMKNGIIEYDCKSTLLPDCWEATRGFIGIGFRILDNDMEFEGFYVRPTNGKSCDNAFRKAHGCQYFAYPGYIWPYYREFGIDDYENPVSTIDLDEWIYVKAVLKDEK